MSRFYTPLRYPGGKAKLTGYIKQVFKTNNFYDGHYVEPYAGGAGIALELLLTEYASHIHLNDLNIPVYAFWHSVLNETTELCRRIETCKVSVSNWRRQKSVIRNPHDRSLFEIGFAFFFLNRTNRSGIINGGVIGGLEQNGKWKIDARFSRENLVNRIQKISEFRDRISITNLDAIDFLNNVTTKLPKKSLIYLDPPYYAKGQRLYDNHYKHDDHVKIAKLVQENIKHPWLVSYDNHNEIFHLYSKRRTETYQLNYSAAKVERGTELMIYSDNLEIPDTSPSETKSAA